MPIETPEIIEQLTKLGKLSEGTAHLITAIQKRPHTIGPEDLQFLEVPFLKPTCKNPKGRNV